jgi:N-methylhydantoinase A
MGAAVHVVTVRRGIDPRGFTLVALGGAAPTHAARLAERFGIARVLVPPRAGVGSAVGLLYADLAIERARTFLAPVAGLVSCWGSRGALADLERVFADLERACLADLGVEEAVCVRSAGIRFIGQAHAFTVELPSGPVTPETLRGAAEEFYKRYQESYGIDLRDPAELTTARVRVVLPAGSRERVTGASPPDGAPGPGTRRLWLDGAFRDVPTRERAACAPGEELAGPCVVTEPQCSLLVPPGWHGAVDDHGALLIQREGDPS